MTSPLHYPYTTPSSITTHFSLHPIGGVEERSHRINWCDLICVGLHSNPGIVCQTQQVVHQLHHITQSEKYMRNMPIQQLYISGLLLKDTPILSSPLSAHTLRDYRNTAREGFILLSFAIVYVYVCLSVCILAILFLTLVAYQSINNSYTATPCGLSVHQQLLHCHSLWPISPSTTPTLPLLVAYQSINNSYTATPCGLSVHQQLIHCHSLWPISPSTTPTLPLLVAHQSINNSYTATPCGLSVHQQLIHCHSLWPISPSTTPTLPLLVAHQSINNSYTATPCGLSVHQQLLHCHSLWPISPSTTPTLPLLVAYQSINNSYCIFFATFLGLCVCVIWERALNDPLP